MAVALALPASAHGPGVVLSAEGLAPGELRIAPGETVHFQNSDVGARRFVGDEQAFHSPELPPGAGWHIRLPFPGRFAYAVEGREELRGVLIVGEPAD